MNKKFFIFTALLLIFSLSMLNAQDKKAKKKAEGKSEEEIKRPANVYFEIILEDFESTSYSKSNLKFRVVKKNQDGDLIMRDQYPAPVKKSKKYLGVKIYGRSGDYFSLIPPKPLVIKKNCSSISIWVYGKGFTGELSAFVEDANGNAHRLVFGKLNFLGWRKLTVKVPAKVVQEDEFLSQKRVIKITKLIYQPGNTKLARPKWQYFYIDDISARVREKYSDRQSDDW
jgi:hypothetical protein